MGLFDISVKADTVAAPLKWTEIVFHFTRWEQERLAVLYSLLPRFSPQRPQLLFPVLLLHVRPFSGKQICSNHHVQTNLFKHYHFNF